MVFPGFSDLDIARVMHSLISCDCDVRGFVDEVLTEFSIGELNLCT